MPLPTPPHSLVSAQEERLFKNRPITDIKYIRNLLTERDWFEDVNSTVKKLVQKEYLFSKSALEEISRDQSMCYYSTHAAKVAQQLLKKDRYAHMDDNSLSQISKKAGPKDKPYTEQEQILRDKQQFFSRGIEMIDKDSATLQEHMESAVDKQQHLYNLTQLYDRVKGHHGSAQGTLRLKKFQTNQSTYQTIKALSTTLNTQFDCLLKRIQEQITTTQNILRQEEEAQLRIEDSIRAQRKKTDQSLLSKAVSIIPRPLQICLKELHYDVGMPPVLGEETHRLVYPLQNDDLDHPTSPGRSAKDRVNKYQKQATQKCPPTLKRELQLTDFLMLMSLDSTTLRQGAIRYFQQTHERMSTTERLSELVTKIIYPRIKSHMSEEHENLHLIPNMMIRNDMTFPGTKEANIAMLPIEFFCNAFLNRFPHAAYIVAADRFTDNRCLGKITIDLMYPLIGDSSSIEDKRSILQININGSSRDYTATNIHQINAALMEIAEKLHLHIDSRYKAFRTTLERANNPTELEVKEHVEGMLKLLESIPEGEDNILHSLMDQTRHHAT